MRSHLYILCLLFLTCAKPCAADVQPYDSLFELTPKLNPSPKLRCKNGGRASGDEVIDAVQKLPKGVVMRSTTDLGVNLTGDSSYQLSLQFTRMKFSSEVTSHDSSIKRAEGDYSSSISSLTFTVLRDEAGVISGIKGIDSARDQISKTIDDPLKRRVLLQALSNENIGRIISNMDFNSWSRLYAQGGRKVREKWREKLPLASAPEPLEGTLHFKGWSKDRHSAEFLTFEIDDIKKDIIQKFQDETVSTHASSTVKTWVSTGCKETFTESFTTLLTENRGEKANSTLSVTLHLLYR